MKTFLVHLFVMVFSMNISHAQQLNLDSLWNLWNDTTKTDINRLKAIHKIAWNGFLFSQPDSAFYFAQIEYDFAESINNKIWMASALNTQGTSLVTRANYDDALLYYNKALEFFIDLNNKRGIANSYNYIGIVYHNKGNYETSLQYHQKSLNIKEKIGDKGLIETSLNNIASIYYYQKNYEQTLLYLNKAMEIKKGSNDNQGLARLYYNIGLVSYELGNNERALDYCFIAISNYEKLENKFGISESYNTIGNVYMNISNDEKALSFFKKALEIKKEIGDKAGIANSMENIGSIYRKNGDYNKALSYLLEAKSIKKEIGTIEHYDVVTKGLYEIYKKLGNNKKALEMHELYMETKDSIAKMNAEEELYKFEIDKEYQLKKQADSIENANAVMIQKAENNANKEKLNNEKNIRFSILGILGIILVFSYFLFLQLKKVNKSNLLIKKQRNELNKSFKEIKDNINYAKKIQTTLLPNQKLMQDFFSDFFVLYQPKDIVGGDFYWYRCFGDFAVIACVDCTGHGVSGGFMSMMGSLLLDKIIQNEKLKPNLILKQLNNDIIRVLKQDSGGEIQDGMDLSLCLIDKKKKKLHFSGAHNSIVVIDDDKVNSYKADLLHAGGIFSKKSKSMSRNFETQTITLNENNWVVMSTDGYYDQLGGDKMMSMGKKKFHEILIDTVANENKIEFLLTEFNSWKGDFQQIDDICLLGFKV